jgi:hypothetical protein
MPCLEMVSWQLAWTGYLRGAPIERPKAYFRQVNIGTIAWYMPASAFSPGQRAARNSEISQTFGRGCSCLCEQAWLQIPIMNSRGRDQTNFVIFLKFGTMPSVHVATVRHVTCDFLVELLPIHNCWEAPSNCTNRYTYKYYTWSVLSHHSELLKAGYKAPAMNIENNSHRNSSQKK